jgi:hypothetical protein
MARGGYTNQQRSDTTARPDSPSVFKIDVGRQVADIELVLRDGGDLTLSTAALAIRTLAVR